MDNDPESARTVFVAWERLRLLYNLILMCVLFLAGRDRFGDRTFWPGVLFLALMANACFSLGPVLEGYIALLRRPRRIARVALFLCGTALSVGLEFFILVFWGWSNF